MIHYLLLVFLFLVSSHAETCEMVSQALSSSGPSILQEISSVAGLLTPAGPYHSAVVIAFDILSFETTSGHSTVMQCTTDFPAVMTQDFLQYYSQQMQQAVQGFDDSLQDYYDSYSNLQNDPTLSQQDKDKIIGSGTLYDPTSTLANLDTNLVSQFSYFTPSVGVAAFPLCALPYLSTYINIRTMVLVDLFTSGARHYNSSSASMDVYGSKLIKLYKNTVHYVSGTYNTSFIQLRLNQISCVTSGPNCCGDNCCGGGYCDDWDPTFDGSLNVADEWNNDYVGYKYNPTCFNKAQAYCQVEYGEKPDFWCPYQGDQCGDYCGDCSDINGCNVPVGPAPQWSNWVQDCQNAAQNRQNELQSQIINELNLVNTALGIAFQTYIWMLCQVGICTCPLSCDSNFKCLPVPNSKCLSPNSIVTISPVAFPLVSVNYNCDNIGCIDLDVRYQGAMYPQNLFILKQNNNGNWCIIVSENTNYYLWADGSQINSTGYQGGGNVKLQFYPSGSDCDGYAEFRIYSNLEGAFVIESVAFPGRYLRTDVQGIGPSNPGPGGVINLQYYSSIPTGVAWEVFNISPITYAVSCQSSCSDPLFPHTCIGGWCQKSLPRTYMVIASASSTSTVAYPFCDVKQCSLSVVWSSKLTSSNQFLLTVNNNGNWCIISSENTRYYLWVDGSQLTSFQADGGGTVMFKNYSSGYNCNGNTEFRIYSKQGAFVIESVAFPGRFLRMDSRGISYNNVGPGGVINLQYYSPGSIPGDWETFLFSRFDSYITNSVVSDDELSDGGVEGMPVEHIVGISIGVGVGVLILVVVVVIVIRKRTTPIQDSLLVSLN